MPGVYDVVDQVGGLVTTPSPYFPPYRKFFIANVNFIPDPMLLMWVKTGYSSFDSAASVRVNGSEIAKLQPRPWVNHFAIDFEAESLMVPRSVLFGGPFAGSPVLNTLEIVAAAGAADSYVLLDKVLFFHNTA